MCYARIKVRARLFAVGLCAPVGRVLSVRFWGGFCPRFGWVFSACFLGVGGCACGLSLGVFWGGVWVEWANANGNGERVKANGRKGARLTACGCPLACRWCPCRRWCPSVKSYLFSVDNIAPMVGGILQPNGNRKTANSMCPLFHTPTFLSPNTEHIRSVGGFGNLPNGGGEFRNRNHGFLLRSIQTIDKFSRTVGNFIEDLLISSNKAYFTWFRTALILVPAATIVTEVFLYNI